MTVSTMLSLLAQGFVTSLLIFALTLLFSLPLGLAVMFGRRSRISPLRWFVKAYISIMRGTPLMLQLMVVFYGPKLLLGVTVPGNWRFTAVIVAFVIMRRTLPKFTAADSNPSRAGSLKRPRCSATRRDRPFSASSCRRWSSASSRA